MQPGAEAAVKDGRPARVQAMSVLGKSHRFVCPRGDSNTETGEISPDRGRNSAPLMSACL